jgi:hypothetical protein
MATASHRDDSTGLVEGLKEEMFQLEIDRLQGTVSPEEYVIAQRALETTITRALARAVATGGGITPRALSRNERPTSSIPAKKPPARPFSINA